MSVSPVENLWLAAVVLFWLVSGEHASAELAFEKTQIEARATSADTAVNARFPFKNTGATTVKILSTKSDCSCTTAKSQKASFLPGESGEIVATFDIGFRMGPQKSVIVVGTDDPSQPFIPLKLLTDIPKAVVLSANMLLWEPAEKGVPKSLVVKANEGTLVTDIVARSDSPYLAVSVERVSATEFRIDIAPAADQQNISATLQVEAILAGNLRKKVNAFLRVR